HSDVVLRGGRRRGNLPPDRGRVLPRGGRRRGAAPAVPRGRSGSCRTPVADVPRAVLGRPAHLQRRARAPTAADAAYAVQDRSGGARRLAALYADRGGRDRAGGARRRTPQGAARL